MNKNLNKIFLNQIRLEVMSILLTVDNCNFSFLKEKTNASQGNLSIQLKKLKGVGYIKIEKTFQNNYPKTKCRITSRGKKSFEQFFNTLQTYKDSGLVMIFGLSVISFFNLMIDSNKIFLNGFFSSQNNFFVTADEITFIQKILKTIMELF
ncbi:MAG: transcriptional regulator [Flavobacteriaceae bacterium]|jgi:hypothetical protein|nr:transcriptional regulator [Flavobacteriaceae bacterium]